MPRPLPGSRGHMPPDNNRTPEERKADHERLVAASENYFAKRKERKNRELATWKRDTKGLPENERINRIRQGSMHLRHPNTTDGGKRTRKNKSKKRKSRRT